MIWTSADERHAYRRFSGFDHLLNLWPKPASVVPRQIANALPVHLNHHSVWIMRIVGLEHQKGHAVMAIFAARGRSACSHERLLIVGLADDRELSSSVVLSPVVLALDGSRTVIESKSSSK